MSGQKLAFQLIDVKVVFIPRREADLVLFIQVWVNPLLRWNVSDYGGITEINIDADKLWKPDIYLYNKYDIRTYSTTITGCVQ